VMWVGRRGGVNTVLRCAGCFGFSPILCANIAVFYNSTNVQMKHVSGFVYIGII
jgi:hypothetical protein